MFNPQLKQLIIYGLVVLLFGILLYLLRWYIVACLIGFGLYQLYQHFNRPGDDGQNTG